MSRSRLTPSIFFARGFLGLGMVGGTLRAISAVVTAVSGSEIERELDLGRPGPRLPTPRTGAVEGVGVRWSDEVSITVEDPDTALTLINAAPTVFLGLAIAATSLLLLVVVVDVQRGVPFETKAASRLRISAAIVAASVLAHMLLTAWADVAALDAADRAGREYIFYVLRAFDDSGTWLLVGALLAVFAHAFREGRRLTDDTEGLV